MLLSRLKNSVSRKKQCARNSTQNSSFVSPPVKVNWVLASPQGDAWNPFIFDTEIPVSVKQQRNERFMLALNMDNHDTPKCRTPRYFAVHGCSYFDIYVRCIVIEGFGSQAHYMVN